MSNVKRIILEPVKERAQQAPMRLWVAAYCRVSTDTEDQRTSFEGQVKTYTKLIEGNPDWTLAGIYADEGGLQLRKNYDQVFELTNSYPYVRRWNYEKH